MSSKHHVHSVVVVGGKKGIIKSGLYPLSFKGRLA